MELARDKHGREIKPGDVLKVYHFTEARYGGHRFLYKQALRYEHGRIVFSHMNRIDDTEPWELGKNYYTEAARILHAYEIVGSTLDDFLERPRTTVAASATCGETIAISSNLDWTRKTTGA